MAASVQIPTATCKKILDGDIDWGNDTIKAMFLDSSHTTALTTQEFADDISANELATSGSYTSGFGNRISLTLSTSEDTGNTRGEVDITDFSATTFTGAVAYIAYIKEVTNDSDSPILAIEDLDGDVTSTAGTWSYTTATEGIIHLNAS